MICLHISAQSGDNGKGVKLTVDRLRREDASETEANVIDQVHDMLALIFSAHPAAGEITVIGDKK